MQPFILSLKPSWLLGFLFSGLILLILITLCCWPIPTSFKVGACIFCLIYLHKIMRQHSWRQHPHAITEIGYHASGKWWLKTHNNQHKIWVKQFKQIAIWSWLITIKAKDIHGQHHDVLITPRSIGNAHYRRLAQWLILTK